MSDNIRIPDSIDMQRLKAMQIVAKMREKADAMGAGFIGGFVGPTGEMFTMTNIEDLKKFLKGS
jgi:hypothetical protein